MARIDPAEVRARYGVDPEQVPDFIALRGDPSDKLPGAPGVGAVGAAMLLRVRVAGRIAAQKTCSCRRVVECVAPTLAIMPLDE